MKRFLLLHCFLFFLCSSPALSAEILVYTAVEPDILNHYKAAFQKQYPDITVKWVRDSAGPIVARMLAEKNNPRADAVFGLSLAGLLVLRQAELLEAYKARDYDQMRPEFMSSGQEPLWTPINAWGAVICANRLEMEKNNLPEPGNWWDLTNEIYRGKIIMPSPVSSSTGLMMIYGWLELMGGEQAWNFMKELDKNVEMYSHSGSRPCQMAARGETALGLSSPAFAGSLVKKGAPLELITPADGVGWDLEASAIIKKDRKDAASLQAAQALMDFSASEEAARLAAEAGYIPARKSFENNEFQKMTESFISMDFEKNFLQRDEILEQWRRLFEK
ncbi:putative 2-aminoethylphosphonate ABC transporter substrate-binding protein [Deltaproteobacteria bacterium Smac51]|nr:putative 2-aminoethylphosphonate ABC transporter substrate-binding protein [Deltaproteobacteria bacterium Smac51]